MKTTNQNFIEMFEPPLFDIKIFVRKMEWVRSLEYGIIATSRDGRYIFKYNSETGILELAKNVRSTLYIPPKGEYFTTIEKSLSNYHAFEKLTEVLRRH